MLILVIIVGSFILMVTVVNLMFISIIKTQNKRIRALEDRFNTDNILIEKLYAAIVKISDTMKRYKLK